METSRPSLSRAPTGTKIGDRLNVGLLPEERVRLNKLAEQDGRTLSAMGRVLLLKGMDAMEKQLQPQG